MKVTSSESIKNHNEKSGTVPKSLRLYVDDIDFILSESKAQNIRVCDFIRKLLERDY